MLMQLLSAALSGLRLGLCPIGFVIVSALFAYRICESTGSMEKIRKTLGSISTDSTVMILLVVWGFGNFMEGIAGFGTAVAIPAAILASIGIDPLRAVVLCLIANTASTAFGSVGVPALTLARAADLNANELVAFSAGAIALVFGITPFLLVAFASGARGLLRRLPLTALVSATYAVPAYFIAVHWGPELPAIVGGLAVMLVIACLHRRTSSADGISARELLLAAAPFLCVIVFLAVYALLLPNAIKSRLTPGAVILLAAILGGFIQRLGPRDLLRVLIATLRGSLRALVIICAILALARVLDTAHVISTVANVLVAALGQSYAFAAAAVGAFGGTLTGSGTSSNVLFGALQRDAALQLGYNPLALAAANLLGSGIGKMICPQSIAIGMAAVGLVGCEAKILRKTLPWFVGVLLFACLACGLLAVCK